MIAAQPHIRAMASYALATLDDTITVSMAQNESAYAPSPLAIEAGFAQLKSVTAYPDADWTALRTAIATVHNVAPQNILCGAGSMELIGCLIHAYAGPGSDILGTKYGYAFVATAARQAQANYIQVDEPKLTVDIDRLLEEVTITTRIVFICNPGNPTGTAIANSEIIRLRDALPVDVMLVVDQAYGEFIDASQDPSEIFKLVNLGNTVILRTFSKAYGLAGLRAGWGLFPVDIAQQVRKMLNPNNISAVTQAMALAAMQDQAYMLETVTMTAATRDSFAVECQKLGLFVTESRANFVLIRFASSVTAAKVDAALRDAGFLMRGMEGYGLPDCLRATICTDEVMQHCARVLQEECR